MASRYFGINRGAQQAGVTQGSSTTSKDLEVVIDLSKNLTKQEVISKLEEIWQAIYKGNFPATTAAQVYRAWYSSRGEKKESVATALPTYATGTVTLATCLANSTVTFDGTVLTAHATVTNTTTFSIAGASDTLDAVAFCACFNSNPTTSAKAVATSALGVVTLTPVLPGTAANSFTLASSSGTELAVSAATLTGGTEVTAGDIRVKLLMAANFGLGDLKRSFDILREYIFANIWAPA